MINGEVDEKYPVIKDTLEEKHTYRYGIHIRSINGVRETDATKEADSWSNLVTMRFALIAGPRTNVRNVSRGVSTSFSSDYKINNGTGVTYISTGLDENQRVVEVLPVKQQFNDSRIPEFQPDFPKFTPGSGSITVEVGLNRPGTIYYVVAEAGKITTGIDARTLVRPGADGNDGEKIDETAANDNSQKETALKGLDNKTYIPTSGPDRDAWEDYIYFMTGTEDGKPLSTEFPIYSNVTKGKDSYLGLEGVFTPDPINYTSAIEKREITGLKAETTYYVYMVLQGGPTATSHVVQVYRVKTEKVRVPVITVLGTSSNSVSMQPSEDCELAFALVELNNLPDFFGKYEDETSVIWRMINPDISAGGRSKFDTSNTDKDIKDKDEVVKYVLGESYSGSLQAPKRTWKIFQDGKAEANNG
ncbi:MAG: hypothetical protein K2K53_09265, partial [Oscillospiraceae bacterium]|nr:hypothetical protein [Oscillospiraceae bacterium]